MWGGEGNEAIYFYVHVCVRARACMCVSMQTWTKKIVLLIFEIRFGYILSRFPLAIYLTTGFWVSANLPGQFKFSVFRLSQFFFSSLMPPLVISPTPPPPNQGSYFEKTFDLNTPDSSSKANSDETSRIGGQRSASQRVRPWLSKDKECWLLTEDQQRCIFFSRRLFGHRSSRKRKGCRSYQSRPRQGTMHVQPSGYT